MVEAAHETNAENNPLDFASDWLYGSHNWNCNRVYWTTFELKSTLFKHSLDNWIDCCHFHIHWHDQWNLCTLVSQIKQIREARLFQACPQYKWNDRLRIR